MKAIKALLLSFLLIFSCYSIEDARSHSIAISLAPYKFFVDAIVGDTAQVNLLIPAGASFHDYEPTPKQILTASKADIWFRIGEAFESHALPALRNANPRMKIVDLREGVDLITLSTEGTCPHCMYHAGADLHIWLSPKQAKIQAIHIGKVLIETYPEYRQIYQERLDRLVSQLDQLDSDINTRLANLKFRTIMVGHPAYAYFTRDYHLQQLPIEYEGRDPSPKQLDQLLKQAKALTIHTIFIQKEYPSKGASLLARELNAKLVVLDPYVTGDYFSAMKTIADRIANQEE